MLLNPDTHNYTEKKNVPQTHLDTNPKEECKVVITRSKRFVEAEDEDSVVSKKKAAEKKGTDEKKDDVRGESNQEKKNK